MSELKITAVPFRSSNLAIPPSPCSPLSPLTPVSRPKKPCYVARDGSTVQRRPKEAPLPWLWQCHECRQTYRLGVTRRCLDDGHHFCSGMSTVRSWKHGGSKIVKKHRACASEFDYAAWRNFGEWRRDSLAPATPLPKADKDCWHNCNFPSECRWGNQLAQAQRLPAIPELPQQVSPKERTKKEPVQQQSPMTKFTQLLQVINYPASTIQTLLSPKMRKASGDMNSSLSLHTVYEESTEEDDVSMAEAAMSSPYTVTQYAACATTQAKAQFLVQTANPFKREPYSSFGGFQFGFQEEDIRMAV